MQRSFRDAIEGHCPSCGSAIPRTAILIVYETASGQREFADCPACGDVVHPE